MRDPVSENYSGRSWHGWSLAYTDVYAPTWAYAYIYNPHTHMCTYPHEPTHPHTTPPHMHTQTHMSSCIHVPLPTHMCTNPHEPMNTYTISPSHTWVHTHMSPHIHIPHTHTHNNNIKDSGAQCKHDCGRIHLIPPYVNINNNKNNNNNNSNISLSSLSYVTTIHASLKKFINGNFLGLASWKVRFINYDTACIFLGYNINQ